MVESPTMLFSEFANLHDDGFEGSLDEQIIFSEIFFQSDASTKNGIILSDATVGHCEYIKQTDMSLCSTSGKSSLTSQEGDYMKEEFAVKPPLEYPSADITSSAKSNNKAGISVKNPPNVNPYSAPSERVISGVSQEDSGSACQSLSYRVVESSGQGVTSRCYIWKPPVHLDKGCEISCRGSPKNGVSFLDQNDQTEAANKAVTSPISQESYASRLLVNDPPVPVAKKLLTNRPTKPKWKDSCFLKLDEEEFAFPKDIKNDPRPLIRYHIHRLLRASCWEVGRRKRNSKYNGIGEYIYKTPEGRPIREFHRAWSMCGGGLLTDANITLPESDGRQQWSDMTEFWTDISRTVKEIDDKLSLLENTADMARLWCLLDPFAIVIFIDKEIRSLKDGITIKAKRSVLLPSDARSVAKFRKIAISERSHANFFDVPINSGAPQLRGGPGTLLLNQDCSTSAPSLDKTKNEEGDFDHIKKTHKKSRKISEMELTGNHSGETSRARSGYKKSKTCRLNDDDLLISAIMKTKTCGATNKWSTGKSKPLRKRKAPKGSCMLLPRSLKKGAKHIKEGNWYAVGSRTVLSWLIHSGVVSPNEVIQYRDLKDDVLVKEGLVTRNGILCKCCNKVLSISEFKIHAGFRSNRPSANLFMESGKPFTLCQLEAWSVEYKERKVAPQKDQVDDVDQNDDSCGRCGDVGELICCDNCPSAFHQACLFEQELPEGNWYCPQCRCQICKDAVNDNEASQMHGALKCSQCEHKYHETCVQRAHVKARSALDTWFCGVSCDKVYTGLKSRIGLRNLISDGFSWTLLRCIPGDQKVHSAQRAVALKAECNSKLAVAITIMEECFLPMVDMKTGIDMMPQLIYNWGSQFARLNYNGFYTVVLEKDDAVLSVASIRIHGVAVAELPLVATCSKNRRQGLCRRLINSIEEMLKALKVEKLVISAIPTLVETWTVGFGFQPLDEDERQSLSKINLMVFPGAVWLKKPLYESCTVDEKPDNVETGVFSGDPENLQNCNGHTLATPQDQPQKPVFEERGPKPSCHTSSLQETACSESENQQSKLDESASIVTETRFEDSDNLKIGEQKKPGNFLDETYSRQVHDCGILHNPVRTGFSAAG